MPNLRSRHPIGPTLPALLQEDPFLQRFTAGLDEALAPLLATLDGLDCYVDPALAPEDFLDWLAGWIALELDPSWPVDVRRSLLRSAAALQEARGTAAGLAEEIALLTGARVQVCDPGGVAAGPEPGTALPAARPAAGIAPGTVVVRVLDAPEELLRPDSAARARLHRAVRAAVPAHLPVVVEVPS